MAENLENLVIAATTETSVDSVVDVVAGIAAVIEEHTEALAALALQLREAAATARAALPPAAAEDTRQA
jgi:mannitol/fructose-specific phosphotransferase system IIA component